MTTVAEKWAEVLGGIGVRYVFGIPSGPWVEYMEALRTQRLWNSCWSATRPVRVSWPTSAGGSRGSPGPATVRLVPGQPI